MIRFRCRECGKKLKAEDDIVGRNVKCTRCGSVETVPEADNLAKPNQPKIRPAVNQPNPPRFGSASRFSDPKTVNLDQPVELFGHSAVESTAPENFEPRFNVVVRRPSNLRRWVLFGLIGVFVVAVIAAVFNFAWILDMRRRLSTDYENLDEVVYYRNAARKLEKSRRMMYVSGKTYIATTLGNDVEIQKLDDYNASIEAVTADSDIYEKVEALFRNGKDVQAKALLVSTALELDQLREEVEKKTVEYTKMTNPP